jgi:hypothetical protein
MGWVTPVVLALASATMSVVNPGVLFFVPFALLLLAVPPRRPALVLIGLALLATVIFGQRGDTLWWFGRGWSLMVGAWFVAAIALLPQTSFIDRGLTAVFGAVLSSAVLFVTTRAGWTKLDVAVSERLRDSASAAVAQLGPALGRSSWGGDAIAAMYRAADLQTLIYPALLALATLSALAVVWWLWRRVTVSDARPLAQLRDFRFRDELVWVVIAAVALILLPLNQALTRAGTNVVAFMGALYALRGLAVALVFFGAPGPVGMILGGLVTVFLFPMVLAGMLVLGLFDTWLDLRARTRPRTEP